MPATDMAAWRQAFNEYMWAHDALVKHVDVTGATSVMSPKLRERVEAAKRTAAKLKAVSSGLLQEKG